MTLKSGIHYIVYVCPLLGSYKSVAQHFQSVAHCENKNINYSAWMLFFYHKLEPKRVVIDSKHEQNYQSFKKTIQHKTVVFLGHMNDNSNFTFPITSS